MLLSPRALSPRATVVLACLLFKEDTYSILSDFRNADDPTLPHFTVSSESSVEAIGCELTRFAKDEGYGYRCENPRPAAWRFHRVDFVGETVSAHLVAPLTIASLTWATPREHEWLREGDERFGSVRYAGLPALLGLAPRKLPLHANFLAPAPLFASLGGSGPEASPPAPFTLSA